MKPIALLCGAAILYALAAWNVPPGFYDCCSPPQSYNWVSPPRQVVGNNQPPASGHADLRVVDGRSEAASAFTGDGQLVVGFLPGVFDSAGSTAISIDINPEANFPDHHGVTFVTNVYLVTASAKLANGASLIMLYSDLLPQPNDIYFAPAGGGMWKSIGHDQQGQPYTIGTTIREFGYFAAGYPSDFTPSSGGQQALPIVVALLILVVLFAGVPLEVIRRRRRSEDE